MPLLTSVQNVTEADIQLYPNPFSSELFVDFEAESKHSSTIKIISLQGVVEKFFETDLKHTALDMSDIPPSLYVVEVYRNNIYSRYKMLKTE